MNKSIDALSTYEKDVKFLQGQVHNRKLYNFRLRLIRLLLKGGIMLDYALPFIVSSVILGNRFAAKGNSPFFVDEIVEKASMEITDTSEGLHTEKISYDYDYSGLTFEHSTGWKINSNGLYERVVTKYLTEGIDFSDPQKIFSMTKEEVAEKFVVYNIETIQKNSLDDEDKMYENDSFVIVQHKDSEEEVITRDETFFENLWNSVFYLILVLVSGAIVTVGEKKFLKVLIRDKIKEQQVKFVDIEESEEFLKILSIREENIALLDDNCEYENFQLRKK